MIELDEQKPKKKRKSPGTKGKGKPAAYHPSEARSKAAKRRQPRDEGGVFLGKRQIRLKIDYSFEEQRYRLEMKSGDGKINETLDCGGIPRLLFVAEKTIKKWRGELV